MAGERNKIRVQRLHIQRHVGRALRRIQHGGSADGVRPVDDLFHRIDAAKHVGNMADGDQLRLFADGLLNRFVGQRTVRFTIHVSERRACLAGDHLPRKHVAVVLHDGNDDFVACLHVMQRIAVSHKVQALGRVSCENHTALTRRMDEALYRLARILIHLRRLEAQRIKAAKRVRIRLLVKHLDRLNHAGRALGRRRIIQIHDRIVLQQRKIFAPRVNRLVHRSSPSSAGSRSPRGTAHPECGGRSAPAWRAS